MYPSNQKRKCSYDFRAFFPADPDDVSVAGAGALGVDLGVVVAAAAAVVVAFAGAGAAALAPGGTALGAVGAGAGAGLTATLGGVAEGAEVPFDGAVATVGAFLAGSLPVISGFRFRFAPDFDFLTVAPSFDSFVSLFSVFLEGSSEGLAFVVATVVAAVAALDLDPAAAGFDLTLLVLELLGLGTFLAAAGAGV